MGKGLATQKKKTFFEALIRINKMWLLSSRGVRPYWAGPLKINFLRLPNVVRETPSNSPIGKISDPDPVVHQAQNYLVGFGFLLRPSVQCI